MSIISAVGDIVQRKKTVHSVRPFVFVIAALSVFVPSFSCVEHRLTEAELEEYLDEREAVFEDISVQMGTAVWNLYTDEGEADQVTPKKRFSELFSSDSLNTIVDTWYKQRDTIEAPGLARRVEIWHNILTGSRVNHAEDVSRIQTELETWLTEEDTTVTRPSDEELESAMLTLMRLRDVKAREIGFDGYPDMMFEITGIGSEWFYNFVATIDSVTSIPYQEMIARTREEIGKDTLEYADVRELVMPFYRNDLGPAIENDRYIPLMKETVENIGIDYDVLPVRFVEAQMPAGIGGQGFAIRIPDDFRAVMAPELPFEHRMHELGHGLQWMFTKTDAPILKGYEWCFGNEFPGFSEGMAETMAWFTKNHEWQKKYTGSTDSEIDAKVTALKTYAPVYLRFQLVIFMFEIEFYNDLDRDAIELYNELLRKYLLVDKPTDRLLMPLANMAYVSYPVYLQNYLLADMVAWQVHQALEKRYGRTYAFDERVSEFLVKELYENGELVPWRTRLKNATGRELDLMGYLGSLGM